MRTRNMEPNQPGDCPRGKYDLRPIPPSLVVPLETRRRSVRNNKTKNGTKTTCRNISHMSSRQKSILTNTVSRVLAIPKLWVVALMTEMAVDQAPKKISICQHLKSAVARIACQKVELNDLSCLKGSGKEGPLVADTMEN
jgi:hypothetical protein